MHGRPRLSWYIIPYAWHSARPAGNQCRCFHHVFPSLHAGLWISINWFVLNIGLVDASKQEAELFGTKKAAAEEPEEAAAGKDAEPAGSADQEAKKAQ